MNAKQMEYAVLLAETGSFSLLAEKLGISQPALSKQIMALEKELGVLLFDRGENPLALTAAGEFFVREAKALLYQEDQLLRSIGQFKTGERGQLVIGTTYFRSAYLLPGVVKKVRQQFPGVRVRLVEMGSGQLRKDAADGKFDFALVNLPVDEAALETIPMEPDSLALVVPEALAEKHTVLKDSKKVSFCQCRDIPFVVASPGQEMRLLFDKLCQQAGVEPDIASEVVGLTTAWRMAQSGVAATLLPRQFVSGEEGRVRVYEIADPVDLRQPAIVYKRGQYLSDYAKYAMEVLTKEIDN